MLALILLSDLNKTQESDRRQNAMPTSSKHTHTWDHEQHRVDLDEAIGGRLACDAAVQLTKHQDCWQGEHKQGANFDNSVGQHELLDPA